MNIEEIKTRVQRVRAMQGDNEAAHYEEDLLYQDFVEWIKDHSPPEIRILAAEVLSTRDIHFVRWYA